MASRPTLLLIPILMAALILAAGCTGPAQTGKKSTVSGTGPVMLSGIPDVRQAEYYSCGASSFQAVMNYYGKNSPECDLRMLLNTTPSHGTYPWDMVRVAKMAGFGAEWKENLSLSDLEKSLREGVPVITDSQRFKATNKSWAETWDAGHYMVVIGLDEKYVYLEDPYLLGERLKMTREDFDASWHDYECDLPVPPDAKKYYRIGVFIRGTVPSERPAFVGADVIPLMVEPVGTGK